MSSFPFLPSSSFNDFQKTNFRRSQTLDLRNGYAVQKHLPSSSSDLTLSDLSVPINPQIIYGQSKVQAPQPFIPNYVHLDKKVLKFDAWFQETIPESPLEKYRVRKVEIFYYLEDDSILVHEPVIENSGLLQGKLVQRQKLRWKNGEEIRWKDLNIGRDITCFGRSYHIYDCDLWTKEFLESEGIEVKEKEECPDDPFSLSRVQRSQTFHSLGPSNDDKLRKFLSMDRMVLRFFCVWDDRKSMFGDKRKFILHYFLVDDTLELREVHRKNNGRDPFSTFISRQKIPKSSSTLNPNFPSATMEIGPEEVHDYVTPKDLKLGSFVVIHSRPFFLYDCDQFTKIFYQKNYNFNMKSCEIPDEKKLIPNFVSNFQNREDLFSAPPRKDFVKTMNLSPVVLRYEAVMDTIKPEFKKRKFIISYRLADKTFSIYEIPVKNSGIIGGKFLERSRVAKPGSNMEKASFYGPKDLYEGAEIDVFRHKFIITRMDEFSKKFIEQNPDLCVD